MAWSDISFATISHGVGLPKWASPIFHAVVVDHTWYLSGQLPVNDADDYCLGTARDDANRAF